MKTQLAGLFLSFAFSACAETPAMLSLKPAAGMTRADIYCIKTVENPKAVLALFPGCNGNGAGLVADPVWQAFAKENELGLIGISFASELSDIHNGKGYYYAGYGSGDVLLSGVDALFGNKLPVLLYGFSGGAHFTARFVEWKPERVIAWCAYSAGWWDEPQPSKIMPPGIVACGEDDVRLGASLVYFKQGRAATKPWLWIGIPRNGHSPDKRVESFVRNYFESILQNDPETNAFGSGLWVDIDMHTAAEAATVGRYPSITAWLPDAGLLNAWRSLNRGE